MNDQLANILAGIVAGTASAPPGPVHVVGRDVLVQVIEALRTEPEPAEMGFQTFMRLAREYNKLGWAVQDQLDNILGGEDLAEQNPNALKLIRDLVANAEKAGVYDDYGLKDEIEDHLGEQ